MQKGGVIKAGNRDRESGGNRGGLVCEKKIFFWGFWEMGIGGENGGGRADIIFGRAMSTTSNSGCRRAGRFLSLVAQHIIVALAAGVESTEPTIVSKCSS
jgi:hypothetical protein